MPLAIHEKLKAIPLFKDFNDSEIEELLQLMEPTGFNPGEVVVRQGDPGNCMYYVVCGQCSVAATRNDQTVVLAELGPGEVVGELSLFDHQPRSADVIALTYCVLLKCNEGVLNALAGVYPGAAFKFIMGVVREIGDRLRRANKRYLDTVLGPV